MLDPFHDEQSQIRFARLERLLQSTEATAIVGAGVSASAGLPSWNGLYSLFCREVHGDDDPECTKYSAELVTRKLQELRNQLGDDRALKIIKDSFDKPVVFVPEEYQLASEAFRRVVTTNYDNFLMTLALRSEAHPTIEVYPRVRVEARYFYLHGHAATAQTIQDIVLCTDEYEFAYDPIDGEAKSTLWRLLQDGPCVFIGTSLEDPDFLHTIKQTEASRRHQIKRRGGITESYNLDPDWFLFKAVPQPPKEIQDILQAIPDPDKRKEAGDQWIESKIGEETDKLLNAGVKPIWFMRDPGYSRLRVLLRRLRDIRRASAKRIDEPVFLTQAEELESLGKVEQPDLVQQQRLLELLRNLPEARRHFFLNASSPGWFDVLYNAGMISLVPEPQQDPNGLVSIDSWDAAVYVSKLLKSRPESVATVISEVQTSNWHALSVLSSAMTELPTELLLPLIPNKIVVWLNTPYAHLSEVGPNSLRICTRLVDQGQYENAAQLIGALLQPKKDNRSGIENTVAGYVASEVLNVANQLSSVAAETTVPAFEGLIDTAMPLEYGSDQPSYWSTWRPAIEDSEVTLLPHSTLNLLVSGLRDAVTSLVDQQPDAAQELLKRYLACDKIILRRVGLHVVSLSPELISSLEESILPGEAVFDSGAFHENATLLQSHFADFSADERTRILKLIASGPSSESAETKGEDRKSVWQWRLLSVLPLDQLPADLQTLRKSLQDRWGVPGRLTFLAVPEVTFAKSPASLEQVRELLSEQGTSGLLRVLRTPEKHFTVGSDTDVSLGWQHVNTLVVESPTEMLSLAPLMTLNDLEIDGAWWYLDAYTGLARAGKAFDWQPLLDLADITVAKLDREPDWDDANWLGTLARLLETGIVSANRIPDDQLFRVFKFFQTLIERFARPVTTGVIDDDLHIHQLNSIAGISANGMVQIAWRCLEETAPAGVRETLRKQLLYHLRDATKGTWGGQEAVFAIGRELPVLERLSAAWVEEAIRNLYSIGDEKSRHGAIQSFWSGYLTAPQVYNFVMQVLRERYGELLRSLEGEANSWLDEELQSRLAEHIVVGWLRGLEGFGIEGLTGQLAHLASDSVLARTAWYIGKQLEALKEAGPDHFTRAWEAVLAYWRLRVEILEHDPTLQPQSALTEADRFTTFLGIGDVEPKGIQKELGFTIRLVSIGIAWRHVVEYLIKHASKDPSAVAAQASALADRWVREPELVISSSKFGPLLREIILHGTKLDRQLVEHIVDRLLREGKVDLREFLEES